MLQVTLTLLGKELSGKSLRKSLVNNTRPHCCAKWLTSCSCSLVAWPAEKSSGAAEAGSPLASGNNEAIPTLPSGDGSRSIMIFPSGLPLVLPTHCPGLGQNSANPHLLKLAPLARGHGRGLLCHRLSTQATNNTTKACDHSCREASHPSSKPYARNGASGPSSRPESRTCSTYPIHRDPKHASPHLAAHPPKKKETCRKQVKSEARTLPPRSVNKGP